MGFHEAACGLYFGHNRELKTLFRLIAKNVYLINGKDEKTKIVDWNTLDTMSFEDETEFEIELHDDIIFIDVPENKRIIRLNCEELTSANFSYSCNEKIKIGEPHCCAFMIYICCVGDDSGYTEGPIEIEQSTLSDLFAWKKKLVKSDRLISDVKFQLVGNCCS